MATRSLIQGDARYDTSGASTDSDGDGCSDSPRSASDGNRAITDADRLAVARRYSHLRPDPDQDYVFDLTKNGVVDDPDRLLVARLQLVFMIPPCL
jgi:hypothetical protein